MWSGDSRRCHPVILLFHSLIAMTSVLCTARMKGRLKLTLKRMFFLYISPLLFTKKGAFWIPLSSHIYIYTYIYIYIYICLFCWSHEFNEKILSHFPSMVLISRRQAKDQCERMYPNDLGQPWLQDLWLVNLSLKKALLNPIFFWGVTLGGGVVD